ncbi:hypothetical protein [Halodesulfovibrio sp.]|jgi:hypothetical protein|uniref:hypothetical protein n=1 Tax=Halodesulfovibrio sp. TaxID=1912772 RepID=UPI0025D0DD1A|nr:hypothetical protein [Halodesulfovibrio sp.]MCT4625676.1 hypothetical protein [Halodesulfovibrio sp.]
MRVILQEYLASMKERDGLDAILPDLLAQMGLIVFSRPSTGGRQYGVDVAAVGCLGDIPRAVYLFSIKAGEIGRSDWNSGKVQDLQPSLDEILDVYIPTHLPKEYSELPIKICICCGGGIREAVRLNITAYEKKKSTDKVSFEEWTGDQLAFFIEKYFLREELVPEFLQSDLRRALALLNDPDAATSYFSSLIYDLHESVTEKNTVTVLRQMSLCLWILFAWCEKEENLGAAIAGAELTILFAWNIVKNIPQKRQSVWRVFSSIFGQYSLIMNSYLEDKIFPYVSIENGLTVAVRSREPVDVNRRIIDLGSLIALNGIWFASSKNFIAQNDYENYKKIDCKVYEIQEMLKKLIVNNRTLLLSYSDDQSIDFFLMIFFLSLSEDNTEFVKDWITELYVCSKYNYLLCKRYPSEVKRYEDLLFHPLERELSYNKDVTRSSIFYPMLAMFTATFGYENCYNDLIKFCKEYLEHCNMQYWFPDKETEKNIYINSAVHGVSLTSIPLESDKKELLKLLKKECSATSCYEELSAVLLGYVPLVLLACRKYRYPIPLQVMETFWGNMNCR